MILLIGLAVGVDYSMFYLRREREERAGGASEDAALETAAATSGRAVLVSGITVAAAMAGMYFAGAATFDSFASGTILVVAIAVVGSLTVLPAVLAKLGDRVNKARVPFLTPPQDRVKRESRLWNAILNPVLRRPGIAARARRRGAARAGDPRARPEDGRARNRLAAAGSAGDPDLRPHPGRLPRQPDPRRGRDRARRRIRGRGLSAASASCARRPPAATCSSSP